MTTELKKCPFCGGERIMFSVEGHFKPWENKGLNLWYRCRCYECGAEGFDSGLSMDMSKAAKEWNTRDNSNAEKLEPLGGRDIEGKEYKICRKCSAIVEDGEWKANYCPDCGQAIDWKGGAE